MATRHAVNKSTGPQIKKGLKFRYHYADANPEWVVVESRGAGTWLCEIIDCPDYSGSQQAFLTEQIQRAVESYNLMNQVMKDCDAFYNSLTLGQIVHYRDSGESFVRCEVVEGDMGNGDGFGKQLLPVAMVGKWNKTHLPMRMIDGSIHYPHQVQSIREKRLFHPHSSNLWEARKHNDVVWPTNPTRLKPLSFELPEMTPAQAEEARLCRLVKSCIDTLQQTTDCFEQPAVKLPMRERLELVLCKIADELDCGPVTPVVE